MPRVLVSAYACEPDHGSEPGVGWHWVQEIARLNEVWIITRENNREPIELALISRPLPNTHWIYFDLPRWTRFWKRGGTGVRSYYFLWQIGAYWIVRRLLRQVDVDVIHHLTFGTYWLPTLLALFPVPFVWGPLGGAESAPTSFSKSFGIRARAYEGARDLIRGIADWNPLLRLTAKRAAIVLCKTADTKRRLGVLGARRATVCSEVGLSADEIARLSTFSLRSGACRFVSIGRLIHWKGFELALRAFARVHAQHRELEYWLIGDGPERKRLDCLARTLGIADYVRFAGRLSRTQALEALRDCDVLVHPSLHDSGGWVCVEAMAAGRPIICLDTGGPATQVTPESGIKIRVGSCVQVVTDLAAAMLELANDRPRRERLASGARQRVADSFSWDQKRAWLTELYFSVEHLNTIPPAAAVESL